MVSKNILFDAERLKYPNTGLYYFCLNLGDAIRNQLPSGLDMYFFCNEKAGKVYGDDQKYIRQFSWHKINNPHRSRFDLWHSTFQLTDYLPNKDRSPLLLTIHDLNFLKENKSLEKEKRYLKKLQERVNQASQIVTISDYVKNDVLTYCDVKNTPIKTIYNGNNIDFSRIAEVSTAPLVDGEYIYSVGTINRKKNFHVLLYLLPGNDLKLVISGETHEEDYKNYILHLAKKLSVQKRLIFTGAVSEKNKYNYLKHCALFAFPSIAEGFGLPVVEAMAFGKKVLLSTCTSLPEIGGDNAYYLTQFDEDYLTNFAKTELNTILRHPIDEHAVVERAKSFNWQDAARDYTALYARILNGA